MVSHSNWGWGKIVDIRSELVFLRFPGGFSAWFDRTEFTSRIPRKMPRSKCEVEFFRKMGYAVPDLD